MTDHKQIVAASVGADVVVDVVATDVVVVVVATDVVAVNVFASVFVTVVVVYLDFPPAVAGAVL